MVTHNRGEFETSSENRRWRLRQSAEAHIASAEPDQNGDEAPESVQRLLHELRVHQVELELQNDELQHSHEALALSQARYFDLYDLAPVGYITLDHQGVILEANLAASRLLDRPRSILVRTYFSRYISPDDSDAYYRMSQLLVKTGQPQTCDVRIRGTRTDIAPRWVRLDASATVEMDGESPMWRVTLVDITRRKQAEEELWSSQKNLLEAERVGQSGSWEHDLRTDVVSWSANMFRVFDTDIVQPGDRFVQQCVYREDRERYRAAVRDMLAGRAPLDIEFRSVRRDSSLRVIHARAEVTFDVQHRPVRVVGRAEDVTERRKLEEERLSLREQLVQAQKMETIGRLAGGIAHDFNNMLGVISLRTEMALMAVAEDSALYAYLTDIFTTAQRSADLVRQLLGFARKQVIAPIVLDLNATIGHLLPMLRRLIGETIELEWRPADSLWPVMLDPSQVDQVLVNLCVNARDAIDGFGRIVVTSHNLAIADPEPIAGSMLAPGEYVMLTVRDTGYGMSKETLAHIFEPYFTTKKEGKGTGLGLATVYGIVQQNHGTIQVSSEPGAGTEFSVLLPRTHAQPAFSTKLDRVKSLPQGRGETILLVEDDANVLQMAKDVLQYLGYTLVIAATPKGALYQIEQRGATIDLLVTDIVMPQMSGRELAQRIGKLQPNRKVLYVSGYPVDYLTANDMLESGVRFLQKPYSLDAFASAVRELLDSA